MFLRKNWLSISVFIVAIVCVGLYLLTTQTPKAPVKIYKPVERSHPATPKPPPPGETYETGHWHGDEWHAEPHEPALEGVDVPVEDYRDVELEAYEASLSHFTAEERATYDRALTGEITRHREKYPDCQDYEAVFEDADRFARWYVKDKEHRKIFNAALADFDAVALEILELPADYHELRRMTDVEKQSLIAKSRDLHQRNEETSKRIDEINQQSPVPPKPRHTH